VFDIFTESYKLMIV